ncbi:NUDIX hydrolase [Haloarcula pelagica]|uniref:NUDIX hydrolase n=1 Tax=Haloarcula pelagica TaxID=3033389 RepID=UPI0024C2D521|nr:NUDIX domain-containing protein [Halomicroarcula sp. YJ-61-S]
MTERHLHATVSIRGVLRAPDGDVLLLRRASNGGWELPGGRLNADDDDVPAGLHREISEETGLDATIYEPVHAVSWRNEADEGRFAVYYHCRVTDRAVSVSAEHTAHDWLPVGEATDRLSDPQATAAERVADAASGD